MGATEWMVVILVVFCQRRVPMCGPGSPTRSSGSWVVFASTSSGFADDLLLCDSTPGPCAASRETVKRSALGDAAGYGY
ncbi:MAG TPA: hypothetical protein VFH61_15070 [Thermoleophilia bacterium]|nr:hypothetical protein [Thermoleophilia bacterium]